MLRTRRPAYPAYNQMVKPGLPGDSRRALRSGVPVLSVQQWLQLCPRGDAQRAEGVGEVPLDRLRGEEQFRGDLTRGPSLGGQLGHAPLAGGERRDALTAAVAWSRARRQQFRERAIGERRR